MKLLKAIWRAIANYRYKMWTLLGLVIASGVVYRFIQWRFLEWIVGGAAACLFVLVWLWIGSAIRNSWRDGDKAIAIAFGIFALAFLIGVVYILIAAL